MDQPEHIVSSAEAAAETVVDRELAKLKKGQERQEQMSWNIIIGVAAAFILTVGMVVVEVALFHTRESDAASRMYERTLQEIGNIRDRQMEMEIRLMRGVDSSRAAQVMEGDK